MPRSGRFWLFLTGKQVNIITFEINNLLERSKQGLLFTGEKKDKIGLKVEALMETSGFNRTLLFLEILNDLAQQNDYKVLNGNGYAFESDLKGSHKVDTIFNYITAHFKDDITLEAIADKTGMTVPSFCRFFKNLQNFWDPSSKIL